MASKMAGGVKPDERGEEGEQSAGELETGVRASTGGT